MNKQNKKLLGSVVVVNNGEVNNEVALVGTTPVDDVIAVFVVSRTAKDIDFQ